MGILELLKSVDELAKVIVQKNNELEQLKEGYDSKVRQLNEYIALVQQGLQIHDDERTITGDELLETMKQPIKCSHCHNKLSLDGDFILIPKRKVALLGTKDTSTRNIDEKQLPGITVPTKEKKSKSTSNKRICSYCKTLGHSRAKCPARLGLPTEMS